MLKSRSGRTVALAVLFVLLLGLIVGHGALAPKPSLGDYPNGGRLAVNYDAHVGDRVQVTGTVTQVDPVVIKDQYSVWNGNQYRTGTFSLRVTGLDRRVQQGQSVQVYGTARADGTIQARNSVVVPATNYLYMYGVSALAGLWVLARLIRGWTVDPETLAIERRTTPISLSAVLAGQSTEETDA